MLINRPTVSNPLIEQVYGKRGGGGGGTMSNFYRSKRGIIKRFFVIMRIYRDK